MIWEGSQKVQISSSDSSRLLVALHQLKRLTFYHVLLAEYVGENRRQRSILEVCYSNSDEELTTSIILEFKWDVKFIYVIISPGERLVSKEGC